MLKKLSIFITTALLISTASMAHAFVVYNPVFFGDTSVRFGDARINVNNIPSGNCDGKDMSIDLSTNFGLALYETYLQSQTNGIVITRLDYVFDREDEKCYVTSITY